MQLTTTRALEFGAGLLEVLATEAELIARHLDLVFVKRVKRASNRNGEDIGHQVDGRLVPNKIISDFNIRVGNPDRQTMPVESKPIAFCEAVRLIVLDCEAAKIPDPFEQGQRKAAVLLPHDADLATSIAIVPDRREGMN